MFKTRLMLWCIFALAALVGAGFLNGWTGGSAAQSPSLKATKVSGGEGSSSEEAALLKNAEAFAEAFAKGDAKALAAFWTETGDFTTPTGQTFTGREALEKAFAEFFEENPGVKVRIDVSGYRFPTANVAIEDGITSVIYPDGSAPTAARYTIVHVKRNGQWLIDSLREAPYTPPSNHRHLKGLEWLIGEWVDDDKEGELAEISFAWTDNQNFILSNFSTSFKNALLTSGTQWIGWDPRNKTIRSWIFESSGGFGQATWTREGKTWTIKTQHTLPDGSTSSATNVVTRIDANTLTWEVKDRQLDGKPLPDLKPVKMKRVN